MCILAGPAPSLQLKCGKSGTVEGLRGNRSWQETEGPQGVLSRRGVHCREHNGGGACCSAHPQGPYPARKGSLPAALQPSYPLSEGTPTGLPKTLVQLLLPKDPLLSCLENWGCSASPLPLHGSISSQSDHPSSCSAYISLSCSGAGTKRSHKGPHRHLSRRHQGPIL